MDIDLNDYMAGGYFLVKYINQGFAPSELLPERVISLSGCIGDWFEVAWAWEYDRDQFQKQRSAYAFDEAKIGAFQEWATENSLDPAYGLLELDQAIYIAREFLAPTSESILVGMGLHRELVDDFLTYHPYPDEHPNYVIFQSSDAEQNAKNLLENHPLQARISINAKGNALGFEIISYHSGSGHSWLCSGLEKHMHELFGIRPNQYGLIDTYTDAKKVYEWIAEDEMQGTRSEPEPYYPWLIVRYPIS